MKPILWIGVLLVVIGILSFVIAIPHTQKHGIQLGGASVGVETTTSEKLPPVVGGILIIGGIGLMAVGARKKA